MIAYNHYIKYIPKLKNDRKTESFYSDIVSIEEKPFYDLHEKLLFMMTFFNNQGRDLCLYTDREFAYTLKGQLWAYEIKDVVTFFWYSGSLDLGYIKHKNYTEKLLEYWSLHIVLPIFFTLEERYDFLHAGAVEVDDKPILFIAESFGGKSTMTDFFLKHGHTMISDDKVATYEKKDQIFSVSSYAHHRPYRKMEDLGYEVEDFALKAKPIHAIYELEKADKNAEIKIIELQGVEKFKTLRYASEINISFLKVKRFTYLMRFANIVPLYKVCIPWDMERLDEVYSHIVEHTKSLKVIK